MKKYLYSVLMVILVAGGLFFGKVNANAAMADEAEDIQIGDNLCGTTMSEQHNFYYRFTLSSKQRIVIKGTMAEENTRWGASDDYIVIYDEDGRELATQYIRKGTYNNAYDTYSISFPITLSKGTYYIQVHHYYDQVDFSYSTSFAPSTRYPSVQLTMTLNKGNSLKLGTIISPQSASKKLTWSTSDKSIVSVTSKGKITAKKVGEATITAKCNGTVIKIKVIVQ
ncbi:MAG: Ig-like domain-containing protein [Lachnospiraceae bacterium]